MYLGGTRTALAPCSPETVHCWHHEWVRRTRAFRPHRAGESPRIAPVAKPSPCSTPRRIMPKSHFGSTCSWAVAADAPPSSGATCASRATAAAPREHRALLPAPLPAGMPRDGLLHDGNPRAADTLRAIPHSLEYQTRLPGRILPESYSRRGRPAGAPAGLADRGWHAASSLPPP
jgi:hypothetical protein